MKTIITAATVLAIASSQAQESASRTKFVEACAKAAKQELPDGFTGVKGHDPEWYFFYKELAHLGTGAYWANGFKDSVTKTDPGGPILEYSAELQKLGVQLLLVPVPSKANIYADKFAAEGEPFPMTAYLDQLSKGGANTLDLERIFKAERKKNPDKLLYCKTDSHFSPYATQLIADAIYQRYKDTDWAKSIKSDIKFVTGEEKEITIKGDLTPNASEKLPAVEVTDSEGNQVEPDNADSPIVLLGDSHTAVFSSGGELHTTSSGVADHLQAKFGAKIDRVSNNGSGTHQARVQLLRKAHGTPGYWDKKKLVIWLFTERELTQAPKWIKIPPKP